jgi:ribosomal protein RSM22 (predicted rRNA methylase)
MQLPAELRESITRALEHVSRNALAERARRFSELYRGGGGSATAIRDEADALAYAVARMPATYGAVRNALARLAARCPEFAPRSVLDLGAGPGTASWAAVDAWPEIDEIAQVDTNRWLLGLGIRLAKTAAPALRDAERISSDIVRSESLRSADLVLISYTLAELGNSEVDAVLRSAWAACRGALAVVEPGTPQGYARILRAREILLARDARVAAPCPHAAPCPLAAPDWCHFAERVARTRDHMLVKSAELPYEDEKFSYLVLVREEWARTAEKDRILARPEAGSAGITLKLCRRDGTAEFVTIGKRDGEGFKRAKKLDWGDGL